MRTTLGTLTVNPSTSKVELSVYGESEIRNVGVIMGIKEACSASDLTFFASNSGRIIWHIDISSEQMNRQWLIPASSVIGGGDDTNVSVYATVDPNVILMDLRDFESRYIAIHNPNCDDSYIIIDLCDDTFYVFRDLTKYDIFLCSYPQATCHLPVPIWDNQSGTYSFEDDAWVKPTIKAPKPEEV
jgi:hypothetical protein